MERTNIASYVTDFTRWGNDIAFVHHSTLRPERWSYSRVAKLAWRVARELEARGIGRGDRVMIWGPNGAQWVAAFYGCLARGAIAVPLDEASTSDFVEKIAGQVEPRLLFASSNHVSPPAIPTMGLTTIEESLAHHAADPYPHVAMDRDETAQIVFTSGTTATPKGVRITHFNVLSNVAPIEREIEKYRKYERIFHPIRFLNLLPLSHVFGQFMGVYIPQLLGGEVHFQEALNPAQIVDSIKQQRISVVVAVPRILQSLQHKIERDYEAAGELERLHADIAVMEGQSPFKRWIRFRRIHRMFGLKFWAFISGGATLDFDTEMFWQRLGFAVIQGYGMTETASLVSVNHPFKMSRGSIGKVLPGREIKLDETGEILVRGSNVTPGYWSTDGNGDGRDDGWFRTGDIGELDQHGNLFFKGRKKDVIVTGAGMNVYPEDVEAALNAQPEILDSAVIGFDSPGGPEPVAALILENPDSDPKQAVDRANAVLGEYQRVRQWVVWPDRDFPRTSTQKIRKPAVADFVRARLSGSQVALGEGSDLNALVARFARKGAVASNASLSSDLGLDSLSRVELLGALEERYQVDIDETAFTSASTVADLERLLRKGTTEPSEPADYPYPRWARRAPFTWIRLVLLYGLTLPLAALMCWVKVKNRKAFDVLDGPVLLASNHVASIDAALILSALPGRYRRWLAIAMLGEMLRGWTDPPKGTSLFTRVRYRIMYWLVALFFNVFPLPQQSGFRRSFGYAGELVDRGFSVLVFPEGKRTEDGRINAFRTGVGILAARLGVPVVPVRIDGLYQFKVKGTYFVRPNAVAVAFGEPQTFGPDDDPAAIAEKIEQRVRSLGSDAP